MDTRQLKKPISQWFLKVGVLSRMVYCQQLNGSFLHGGFTKDVIFMSGQKMFYSKSLEAKLTRTFIFFRVFRSTNLLHTAKNFGIFFNSFE